MSGFIYKVYEIVLRSGGRKCRKCVMMSTEKLRAIQAAAGFALKNFGVSYTITECDVFLDRETDLDIYCVRS